MQTRLPLIRRDRESRFVTVKHASLNVLGDQRWPVRNHGQVTVCHVSDNMVIVQLELNFVPERE